MSDDREKTANEASSDQGSDVESLEEHAMSPGSDGLNAEVAELTLEPSKAAIRSRQPFYGFYTQSTEGLRKGVDALETVLNVLKKQVIAEKTTIDPTRPLSLKGYAVLNGIFCSIPPYGKHSKTVRTYLSALEDSVESFLPSETTNGRIQELLKFHEHLAGQVPEEYVYTYDDEWLMEGKVRVDVGSLIADGKWQDSWMDGFESHMLESVEVKAPEDDEVKAPDDDEVKAPDDDEDKAPDDDEVTLAPDNDEDSTA